MSNHLIFRYLAGPRLLLQHVEAECVNKTYIFNPLTRFLLVKYLTSDIPHHLPQHSAHSSVFPTIYDLHYAATNLTYIAKIYNLNASSLASGILLGKSLNIQMTGELIKTIRILNI